MSEYLQGTVKLVAKHVPDSTTEVGPDGNKVTVDLPGDVVIGALVGKAFYPLSKMGKARFDKHQALAEQASE